MPKNTHSNKRLPANLTVEDLLDSLEQEDDAEATPSVNDDVLSFLLAFDIKAGTEPVSPRLLRELFNKWTPNTLDAATFHYRITKYLPKRRIGQQYLVSVDKASWKISEEIQKLILSNTRDKTKSRAYKRHFDNFLKKYNIKPGTFFVESYILYYLYDKWVYGIRKTNGLGEKQFINFCKLYFKVKRNSKSRVMWFGIDKDSILKVISINKMYSIRKARKRRYGIKANKKKQEKQI